MTNLFTRGIRAIRRDGPGGVLARLSRRTGQRTKRIFRERLLRPTQRISPYFYTALNRKLHGHDREIGKLVQAQALEIQRLSAGAAHRLFIDCGANEGAILRRYRTALPGFDFLGFEIQRDVIERARKVNPGTEIRHQAVAGTPGEVEVFLSEKSGLNVRGATSILRPEGTGTPAASYTVPAIRFSDLLAEQRAQGCDFIVVKMDIEGAEYQIIDDLHRVWSQTGTPLIDYLMIEFHPQRLDRPEDNARYEALLTEMGVIYSTWI
ncbi:FkbM family methyltransferase [Rhodovulum adriaticum]|uniref:FkbM family methyltransferase n=1 Tax=Rhodovulum adriaticum TaxID=35804 RepID=A0A4R2NYN8_RHOAD|nr:FkbM family methyltransferase [Rhodovulum adriaticum]MBK1634207.1 hypothetical protein [Rhodovulum adriaticum]TCP27242.1 FkbM family methyltransferase [Rhodovulum adriaticum]